MVNDGRRPQRPSNPDLPSPFDVVPTSPGPTSPQDEEMASWRFGEGSCDEPLGEDDYDETTDDTLPLSILLPLEPGA
jgi:hypothetical protein